MTDDEPKVLSKVELLHPHSLRLSHRALVARLVVTVRQVEAERDTAVQQAKRDAENAEKWRAIDPSEIYSLQHYQADHAVVERVEARLAELEARPVPRDYETAWTMTELQVLLDGQGEKE